MSDKKAEDKELMWPEAPYHYGMGRIREYEAWFHTLNKDEQKIEKKAALERTKGLNGMNDSKAIQLSIFNMPMRPTSKVKQRDYSRERER